MRKLTKPPVTKLIKMLLPDANYEEQVQATEDLREFLAVVYRIYVRLKHEGKLPQPRDKSSTRDTLGSSSNDAP